MTEEHKNQAKLIVNRITGFAPWSNWNGVLRSEIEQHITDGLIEYGNRISKRRTKVDIGLISIGFVLGILVSFSVYLIIN